MGQVMNITDKDVTITRGERIMQAVFSKFLKTEDDFAEGKRTGGFGSTN